jgi:hypothetical protein
VAKEKLNLFQFASTTMAQARASAAKIVGGQIAYAGLPGAPFHRVPDYVSCHASFLSHSPFKTRLNTFPSLTPECRSHASRSSLLHDGTGTVRSRFPFPTKLTMTQ